MDSGCDLRASGIPLACASSAENGERNPTRRKLGPRSHRLIRQRCDDRWRSRGPARAALPELCIPSLSIGDETSLTSVWGSSGSDVWAVGSVGTVLHYDGHVWEKAERAAATDAAANDLTLPQRLARPPRSRLGSPDGHNLRHTTGWARPSATHGRYTPTPRRTAGRWLCTEATASSSSPATTRTVRAARRSRRFDRWADADGDGDGESVPSSPIRTMQTSVSRFPICGVTTRRSVAVSTRARLSGTEMCKSAHLPR